MEHGGTSLTWRSRLLYSVTGAGHSLLGKIQDARYADALKDVNLQPPIFLLGFWRSGTTLLHELFCCDSRFGFPSTYACMHPSHFLLTESWMREQETEKRSQRPMDNMLYSWASPQEDEFALLSLGAPSPYEALLLPSLLKNPRRLLDLRRRFSDEQTRWSEVFLNFIRLLAVQQDKPMVLKSPPHGFRLSILGSVFPKSCFVLIERNPYEVFASNLKLWRTLFDMYGLEPISAEQIEAFVLQAYVLHEEAIQDGLRHAAPRLSRIRYEDLVSNSVGQMTRVYSELKLGDWERVRPRWEQYGIAASGHTRNRYQLTPRQKSRVEEHWGSILREKGYSWSGTHLAIKEAI